MTKQEWTFVLHYMAASIIILTSAFPSDATELVADVLLLKIKDSHVIDIENNDMEDIELFARQPV